MRRILLCVIIAIQTFRWWCRSCSSSLFRHWLYLRFSAYTITNRKIIIIDRKSQIRFHFKIFCKIAQRFAYTQLVVTWHYYNLCVSACLRVVVHIRCQNPALQIQKLILPKKKMCKRFGEKTQMIYWEIETRCGDVFRIINDAKRWSWRWIRCYFRFICLDDISTAFAV